MPVLCLWLRLRYPSTESLGEALFTVHHIVEISSIGSEYKIDPINDLRPVCPNCHVMLHTRRPAIPVDELKIHLENRHSS
ncbi:HNH endonuclease [Paraburkholderia sediminicola]|uniref:HNH endonuclease n=1 Tax=Paraburkholderia sediminicola TaxID=458836 RepID=UPI0038BD43DC